MRLSSFAGVIAVLNTDLMDVYRYTTFTDPITGITETAMEPEPVYLGEPCRISFGTTFDQKRDASVSEEPINYGPKLFCKPNYILLANDHIKVYRMQDGVTNQFLYEGNIGQPGYYSSHIECIFGIDTSA